MPLAHFTSPTLKIPHLYLLHLSLRFRLNEREGEEEMRAALTRLALKRRQLSSIPRPSTLQSLDRSISSAAAHGAVGNDEKQAATLKTQLKKKAIDSSHILGPDLPDIWNPTGFTPIPSLDNQIQGNSFLLLSFFCCISANT